MLCDFGHICYGILFIISGFSKIFIFMDGRQHVLVYMDFAIWLAVILIFIIIGVLLEKKLKEQTPHSS